ncbi:DUF418 domain-containing protein [Pseudoduganella eburnea]|uniref:DUF418 domain-containing protein n=1 Tax=Massilia eburnea TaxID=1776165 RepID=A0A6L6QF02_9BURK|nr:DUF418 domain-containing protein [Massilia eburnea]MTW10835.1 DUF418 domain-containing protein [Massilia eburnea]
MTRLQNVDALRGFALLGILAVNIGSFADPYFASGMKNPHYLGVLDYVLRFMEALLFETKFYLLFSFLFGYSFTLQMTAAERAGAAFRPRMLRRAAGLLMLGVLHGFFLFYGDILHLYGYLSLVLIAWKGSQRQAVRCALALLVFAALVFVGLGVWLLLAGLDGAPDTAPVLAKLAAYHGSAHATQAHIAGEFPATVGLLLIGQAPSALAMFLLGLAAGRSQLLAHVGTFRHQLPRVLKVGLPVGLSGALLYAAASEFPPGGALVMFAQAAGYLTAPFMTSSYVAALLLLFESRVGPRLLAALAPMGKIALSNYLVQSAAMALLFTGYGLRLCGELPPVAIFALVLAIYLTQMALSAWWLKRHTYGPAEWLLRGLTNWNFVRAKKQIQADGRTT